MKIQPFGIQILIKPITKSQILVSDDKTLCEYGEVMAIGDEVTKVKVGDIIGHTVWGMNSLDIENERYYFVPEDSRFILGKITMLGQLAA